jgi:adenylosuccinate lyase
MRELWDPARKFGTWLSVELAVLAARMEWGEVSPDEYSAILQKADFTVERINELDEGPGGFRHDMLAFIETCKETMRAAGLPEAWIGRFHESVTSYDIEDPAFCLLLVQSADLILTEIAKFRDALFARAREHKETLVMGITHGQAAEVTTLATRMLNWVDALERDSARILSAQLELKVGKFSGAVGIYSDMDPRIEECTCIRLGLKPAKIATQIIHRDRHAAYMAALCVLAGNLEHIAHNLWLMCSFPRLEAREPFRKGQRGSSAMPHKKNPVVLERIRGMAAQMRGYLGSIMEMIATYDERSIDQSCVERLSWPDATTLVHYMLYQLTSVISDMQFFPETMRANIDKTLGQCGSGYVKNLLFSKGVAQLTFQGQPMTVYDWVQECANKAWEEQRHLREVMVEEGVLEHVSQSDLNRCFDYNHYVRNAPIIYKRFGI